MVRDEAEDSFVLNSLVKEKTERLFSKGSLKNHITAWNALKGLWVDMKHKINLTHMGYSI